MWLWHREVEPNFDFNNKVRSVIITRVGGRQVRVLRSLVISAAQIRTLGLVRTRTCIIHVIMQV